jgi:F0F1-type ATP synthase assembly protein I
MVALSRRPSPLAYMGLGIELVAPILLGVFVGRWLDGRWGTKPWLLVAGAVLGLVLGFYSFLRSVLPTGKGRP